MDLGWLAPDAIYEVVAGHINQATQSIYYEGYTFKNAHLANIISATLAANPGMTVTMLLEGEPVGGRPNLWRAAAYFYHGLFVWRHYLHRHFYHPLLGKRRVLF